MNTRNRIAPSYSINIDRLMARLRELGGIGALEGGGVSRLAFSDADRQGRDLVVGWMRELGLDVSIDRIGNVIGIRNGLEDGPAVTAGSHIDTVATGGLYDGSLGVLAGLEVIETLNEHRVRTRRPLAVGFFSNEEGARFAPDMMGSGVHQGALDLDTMLAVTGIDNLRVEEALNAIGYAGETAVGTYKAHCYIELHVEQGPVLEEEGITIGAVTGVQGISWTQYTFAGTSNHAGTTPMRLRHDAGYLAAALAVEARALARDFGGDQVATAGSIRLEPNLVNVIANKATITVDLRNTDEAMLRKAEKRLADFVATTAQTEGVSVTSNILARFEPVDFAADMIDQVEKTALALGHTVRRMPSGAGHDAQMFAPNCPTAMIFVPSKGGISHNIGEHTDVADIEAGANVLLNVMVHQSV